MSNYLKSLSLLSMLLLIAACSSSEPGINQPTDDTPETDAILVQSAACGSMDTAVVGPVQTETSAETESSANPELPDPTETTSNAEEDAGCGGPLSSAVNEPGSMPTGTGTINLLSNDLVVDGAAVEVLENGKPSGNNTINLLIHDGEIRILEQRSGNEHGIYWGVYSGSVMVSVELVSSASGQFEVGTFEFIEVNDSNDTALEGVNALTDGFVSYDSDGSGKIDAQNEFMSVVGGNVNITGSRPDWSITLDFSLSNGETLTGQFDGDYIDIPVLDTP